MNNQIQTGEYVELILKTCNLAVLASEANGQPCASLMAITPFQGVKQILFATYRNTRKFENIIHNGRVALLVQGKDLETTKGNKAYALTAYGYAREVKESEFEEALHTHLVRHTDLDNFLHSSDIAIFSVKVEKYQLVLGIDDVIWCTV